MTRRPIADKDLVLNMLREGKTTQHIAEIFGVSRQAIDLHRKDFIHRGLLPDQRAARIKRDVGEQIPPDRKPPVPSEPAAPKHNPFSLDAQIDLMIKALNALQRLPGLEAELETCKRNYESVLREIERLKTAESKRFDQEQRWLSAQRQNVPDTSAGKSNGASGY